MKQVIISVMGGVADVEVCPEGVEVIIKDYDVEGVDDESALDEDENGQFVEHIYGGEE